MSDDTPAPAAPPEKPTTCGLVMPISLTDDCTEQHWAEVKGILAEAIGVAGFDASLVSDADEVGVIQKRIIQNLYENPIVVCDVSGKNPNVMFELGIRLAFDKPTVIVKDDNTPFSFDTGQIEHLEYPRDLRHGKIVAFQAKLADKVKATYDKATSDPDYTTFLKHFGTFSVAKVETKEVSIVEYVKQGFQEIREAISRLERKPPGGVRILTHKTTPFVAKILTGEAIDPTAFAHAARNERRDPATGLRPMSAEEVVLRRAEIEQQNVNPF
jgi:hypothetical protein